MSFANLDLKAMKEWRRAIHQNPELGFEEFNTSRLVTDCLRSWGYEVHTGLAVTGVVGQLVFGDGSGPRLGLRADMDALPLQEQTSLPWQSRTPGKMHACGHDGHTAILLGAAKALAGSHATGTGMGNGTLNLIFQPAEEVGGGGGAQRMMEEGLFDRFPCDAVFGLHNMPGTPVGQCFFRSGPFMCSSDKVNIRFTGKGGHGAMPQLALDPTQPLAATVQGLQSLIGRNIDPLHCGVISVGRIAAGESYNIIPEQAELDLSVRALQPQVRDILCQRIKALAEHQAQAYDCTVQIRYEAGYPVLINSEAETRLVEAVAIEVFGVDNVDANGAPLTASEDFAYMLEQVPGCYLMIGNGDNGYTDGARLGPCSVHNPHYDFNDECLSGGGQLWVKLAERYFSRR
ncbi:M20 aminoacylase family protein [Marinobacterium rhizophilum]|uniref:M20 aminoacylase family protein n=1 Tax=Marinobacterium rhizophilum TaxID=420402 RepID=UPI000363CF93|nr:M20 aminoacylase family protein [Marinobacterium rhizophilum]